MRKERKKALHRMLLILLVLYIGISFIPALAFYLTSEKAPESEAENTESSEVSESAPPDFLRDLSPPPAGTASSEEIFTFYDAATDSELKLTAEEFLPAALACEMTLSAPDEALKAQAVAIYTLYRNKLERGEKLSCDTEQWLIYTTQENMRARWGDEFDGFYSKFKKIAESVSGELVSYEGKPALTTYFAISAGATENVNNVWSEEADCPYLQAVASPGDSFSDGFITEISFTQESFKTAAQEHFSSLEPDFTTAPDTWLEITETTPSGYVKTAKLGGVEVSGTELRSAFRLRSACFEVSFDGGFKFTVRGWGHGVGMSQAGAIFMAREGMSYEEILSHYYPGTELISAY